MSARCVRCGGKTGTSNLCLDCVMPAPGHHPPRPWEPAFWRGMSEGFRLGWVMGWIVSVALGGAFILLAIGRALWR
jgi:hypothetical protein